MKLKLTLTESNIQRELTTSQTMFPRFQNINFPKRLSEFRLVEATVAVVARAKVVTTSAASTMHREIFTHVITRIGRA